jgi:hypothetical protein
VKKLPPLCRYCGKPIRKRTESVSFSTFARADLKGVKPHSIAEAQRHVNGKIVSVRWTTPTKLDHGEFVDTGEPRYIDRVSVWDGESYIDEFFCNGDHAQRYAYAMVRSPHNNAVMPAYAQALAKQKSKP